MGKLDGKVALVTGAARKKGIGRAIALRLAQDGADVVVVGRYRPPELFPEDERAEGWRGLESLVSEIESIGCRAIAVTADMTKGQEIKQMVETALSKFGKIDILVNNAGIMEKKTPVVEMDEAAWAKTIATNLTAPFLCCRAVAKGMIEKVKGGKIINVSSASGKMGFPGSAAYCSSKFGLIGLTQVLAHELAPYKINVNAICPGIAPSDLALEMLGGADAEHPEITMGKAKENLQTKSIQFIPLARLATPDDMANVVAFLASSDSDYMTGQAINVTGGRIMW